VLDNEVFEYLLGDQGCMGEEMYIILKIGKRYITIVINQDVIQQNACWV